MTPHEPEVVRLLVESQSDRQIGERLFSSHRPAMTRVKYILENFEVESRTAAATLAMRRRLV